MEVKERDLTWRSAAKGSKSMKLTEIDDQHLSNILWFFEVFHNEHKNGSEILSAIYSELSKRNVERLSWKPLPVLDEIQRLYKMGMIDSTNGNIIKLNSSDLGNTRFYKIIGNISHIEGWENMIYV